MALRGHDPTYASMTADLRPEAELQAEQERQRAATSRYAVDRSSVVEGPAFHPSKDSVPADVGSPKGSKILWRATSKGGDDDTPKMSKSIKKSMSKDRKEGVTIKRPKEERKKGIETLEDVFDMLDPQDGTGGLNAYRFNLFLEKVGVELDIKATKLLMRQIDLNGDGLIQRNEMRAFFKAAKSRAEMQNSAATAVRDKHAWAKRLFDEFKSKRSKGPEGVRETELKPMLKLLKSGYEKLTDTDLKHCFTEQLENGVVSVDGIRKFLDVSEERDEFKVKLGQYEDFGDVDDMILKYLFDHFATKDESRRNNRFLTGASFAAAVELLPPLIWPPADINQNALKQITGEYKDMMKINLESFKLYFKRVHAARDAQEHIEDFEASDPVKNKFLAAIAAISIAIAVLAFIAGFITGSPLFIWIGIVCFGFALYNFLYIKGLEVEGNAGVLLKVFPLASGICTVGYYAYNDPDSLIGKTGFYLILALGGALVVIIVLKACDRPARKWVGEKEVREMVRDEELGLRKGRRRRGSLRDYAIQITRRLSLKGSDRTSGNPSVEQIQREAEKRRTKKESQSPGSQSPRSPGVQTTESGVLPPRSPTLEGRSHNPAGLLPRSHKGDGSASPVYDRGTPISPKISKGGQARMKDDPVSKLAPHSPLSSKERSTRRQSALPANWRFSPAPASPASPSRGQAAAWTS
jgi:hypothetical protein